MGWGPDAEGINGVYLGKDVVHHAGKAMEMCVRAIAPKILTWKQYGEVSLDDGVSEGVPVVQQRIVQLLYNTFISEPCCQRPAATTQLMLC